MVDLTGDVNLSEVVKDLSLVEVTTEVLETEAFAKNYSALILTLKALEGLKKKVDEGIKTLMEEEYKVTGNTDYEVGGLKYKYIPETLRTTFDSKAFEEQHPRLYKKFLKTGTVRPSLRVTIKK